MLDCTRFVSAKPQCTVKQLRKRKFRQTNNNIFFYVEQLQNFSLQNTVNMELA